MGFLLASERPSGTSDSVPIVATMRTGFGLARESGGNTHVLASNRPDAAAQQRVGRHPLVPFVHVLMTDRVNERRRAAQLARHYRDQEGLMIAEIARRLGRAESTVKAYLYDPLGAKAREVKARYRGVVPWLRRADEPAGRQGRRVRILQELPSLPPFTLYPSLTPFSS